MQKPILNIVYIYVRTYLGLSVGRAGFNVSYCMVKMPSKHLVDFTRDSGELWPSPSKANEESGTNLSYNLEHVKSQFSQRTLFL